MINKYTNKQRGLLAVIMAMVMVFAGAAFVAAEVDAVVAESDVAKIGDTGFSSLNNAVNSAVDNDTIILLKDVEWDAATITDKVITIESSVGTKSKINLNGAMTLAGTTVLTIDNCTINSVEDVVGSGYDNQILVNGSGAKVITNNCTFTYDSVIDDPHAVNVSNGSGEFTNTNFSNSKVTYVSSATYMTFTDCQNVYINTGKSVGIKALTTDVTTYDAENIYIDSETTISSFKVHQGVTITIDDGMNLKAGKILVKDDSKTTGTITGTGTGSITGTIALYEPGIDGNDKGKVNLSGVTFAGLSSIDSDVSIAATNVTVDSKATLNVAGTITNDSTLTNNGTISITDDAAMIPTTIPGSGSVNTSAIQEDAYFGGSIVTKDTVFSQAQIVTITADTTLMGDATLTVMGTLIIPEGVTLTLDGTSMLIMKGAAAKLYNNGTIIVQSEGQFKSDIRTDDSSKTALSIVGGYGENNGTISLVYDDDEFDGRYWINYSMYIVNGTFDNNGTIEISEYNTLGINRNIANENDKTVVNNKVNGSITVEGMIIGFINNASAITIDGYAWGTISMVSTDATVDIISLQTYGVNHELIIDNNGLKYGKDGIVAGSSIDYVKLWTNSNDLTNTFAIEGLIIKTAISSWKNNAGVMQYSQNMDVSGDVVLETTEDVASTSTTKYAFIKLKDVKVTGDLSVGRNIDVSGEKLKVTGNMTLTEAEFFSVTNTEVTGKLVADEALTIAKAAYYKIKADTVNKIPEQHIYTNLADAIAAAPKDITVFGDLTVKSEITVPVGTTVTVNANLIVDEKGKLTVSDGSKLVLKGTNDVDGVLLVENKRNVTNTSNIVSDVVTTDDKTVLYSGLAYALSVATEGQTVKISEFADAEILTEADVTIPAGVILDTNNKSVKVGAGYVLTINGVLYLNNGSLSIGEKTSLKDAGKIVLNGSIKTAQDTTYLTNMVPGAYFQMLEDNMVYNYVEPVSVVASKAADVYGQIIEINDVDNLGDVVFSGTSDYPITIILNDGVESGKVTVEYAKVVFTSGKVYSMIVSENGGSVELVKVSAGTGFEIACAEVEEVETFLIKGAATINDKGSIVIDGKVAIAGITITNGNEKFMTIAGESIVTAASSVDYIDVTGTLTVDNEIQFTVDNNAYVTGNLVAAEKTDSKTGGKVTVTGQLYVGFEKPTVGASGSISGDVVPATVMYVLAGATIPAEMIEDMYVVEFYVDGKLYMTAYATDVNQTLVGLPSVDSEEYDFKSWKSEDGQTTIDTTKKLSEIDGKVSAVIDYDVYLVRFIISEGMDDIYLDGVLVPYTTVSVGSVTLSGYYINVAAGQHTVSYTLANGYTGEAKMLVNGSEISGYVFTASGDYEDGKDSNGVNYTITLQGIEKAPAEVGGGDAPSVDKDEGMDLTDILLIVLVVLIVIMAIIVALRMMRS